MNNDNNIELKNGTVLPVMESFLTIQGEGYFSGKTSYFLRIGGCDVGCHWCDVKESWDPNLHPLVKVDTIIKSILETNVKTVVITGGEPLMWNMEYLTKQLVKNNIQIHLEINNLCSYLFEIYSVAPAYCPFLIHVYLYQHPSFSKTLL